MDNTTIIVLTIVFIPWLLLIVSSIKNKKKRKIHEKQITDLKFEISQVRERRKQAEDNNHKLREKYAPITDVENHVLQLIENAEERADAIKAIAEDELTKAQAAREEAKELADQTQARASFNAEKIEKQALVVRLLATQKLKEATQKAEAIKTEAHETATQIIDLSEIRAIEIAGNALEAKEKADSYEKAILAMKNTIEGYEDDYIIPNQSVLDHLADEFSHKEAGEELKQARDRVRKMVKDGYAGECDYVETHRRKYAIHFAVDAFNGKVDSALAKVKHDNYGKIKQEIVDAFALVNHNGAPFRKARIRREYLEMRLTELRWAVATFELKKLDREQQAAIKAQIREEERARREMEKAQKEAEKEERMLQKALEKARKELAGANAEQKAEYEAQLAELEAKLKEAEEKGQRAISMAQQTKRGHVYVISNIGSFGENVFKIGMTRRLEPMDRVKELGDASVPFSFDVHAMIFSEDAPALEKELHNRFMTDSVNKVNPRKEFFKTNISDVRQAVEDSGVTDVHWTLRAEAADYRESLSIERKREETFQNKEEAFA